jgi:RNA polymerase sigma-70 factor (ECF subfamily)
VTAREDRFRHLFREHYTALIAYAIRRTSQRADAEDVVAEAFSVAWRRIDEVAPGHHEERLWLYGVARRTLANRRRGDERAARLPVRLAVYAKNAPAADSGIEDSVDAELALRALALLSETDQEVVRLAVWEDLSHADIAKVIGTSVPNVAVRLHRAKRRLKRIFDTELQGRPGAGHAPSARAVGHRQAEEPSA